METSPLISMIQNKYVDIALMGGKKIKGVKVISEDDVFFEVRNKNGKKKLISKAQIEDIEILDD